MQFLIDKDDKSIPLWIVGKVKNEDKVWLQ